VGRSDDRCDTSMRLRAKDALRVRTTGKSSPARRTTWKRLRSQRAEHERNVEVSESMIETCGYGVWASSENECASKMSKPLQAGQYLFCRFKVVTLSAGFRPVLSSG
jgi:hypothetical protein